MDKKSKILFLIFSFLIISSIIVTYYRYMIKRDYIIEARVACDPHTERCFVHVCDPSAGEECKGNEKEDTTYYKLIHRNAKNIPLCDPKAEGCNALICPAGEADCAVTTCNSTNVPKGDACAPQPIPLVQ